MESNESSDIRAKPLNGLNSGCVESSVASDPFVDSAGGAGASANEAVRLVFVYSLNCPISASSSALVAAPGDPAGGFESSGVVEVAAPSIAVEGSRVIYSKTGGPEQRVTRRGSAAVESWHHGPSQR